MFLCWNSVLVPCFTQDLSPECVASVAAVDYATLQVEQCKVEEVEEKIRMLTEKHATKEEFISRKAK